MPELHGIEVEDTYCEAFEGLFARFIITARDERRLKQAAYGSTALPSTVFGAAEGGVERWLQPMETPDGRVGALVQIWVNYGRGARERLEQELGKRVRQGVLVVPTTRVFDALPSRDTINTMARIGHCGDGHEEVIRGYGRELISIPLMMGDFLIERRLGYRKGVMGGNVWLMAGSEEAALEAGEGALEALGKVEGAIAPFGICSAGSKVETRYPEIGPTTNHPYCPTLKGRIKESRVPEGVASIPEIVIDGMDLAVVKRGMRAVMDGAAGVEGLLRISAGNYGGKLGKHRIYITELL